MIKQRQPRTVVRDPSGTIVHVGPWDYLIQTSERSVLDEFGRPQRDGYGNLVVEQTHTITNPMPEGYTECVAECVELVDGSWYPCELHGLARQACYPPIAEQLDALWKGGAQAEAMRQQVLAIKDLFPKTPRGGST